LSIWNEMKRIAADQTGGVERLEVGLERNPGARVELGAENPPDVPLFLLRVGLRSGFDRTRAGLPVHRRENPSPHPILKEIYQCEVAGKRLEAANVFALRDKVERQLEVIAPARTLPLCYFRAPRFDYSLPVYQEGSKLVCPVLAGPKIKAEGLAELREPVLRHLRTAGYLGPGEDPEVLVVRPSDLRLVPPAAVVRSLDDPALWLPAVEGSSPEGPVVGLLSHPAELRVSERRRRGPAAPDVPPSGPDVTALLRYLGVEMARRGRMLNPWSLYACDVRPEIWARTEEITDSTEVVLTAHLEGGGELTVPVRHTAAGESVAGIRERGISVFLAGDNEALCAAIGRYLEAQAFLVHGADLRTAAIAAPVSDSLDPDSIWTGSPEFTTSPDTQATEDQEVSRT
jgi:hypothetical protein